MNTKLILTFVLGALLAGGVMYVAVGHKNETAERPQIVVQSSAPVTPASQPAIAPEANGASTPAPAVSAPEPAPAPKRSERSGRAARTQTAARHTTTAAKPSPMPVSQPAPQQTAQNHPPAPIEDTPANRPANNAPVLTTSPVPPPPGTHMEEPVHAAPPPRKPQTVTIPAGTLVTVRLDHSLSSASNDAGDAFKASLDAPLVVDNAVIAERGSRVQGRVVDVDKGGRVSGLARMSLELTTLNTSDGQKVRLQTESFQREAERSRKSDVTKIGAAAGLGAAIGAIAGGGKGAAIGAAVGGAAGTGGVMATRGKAAEVPAETRISFRLAQPVTITEKIQ